MPAGLEIYDQNAKLQFNGEMLTYSCRLTGTTYVENRKIGNTCPRSFLIPTSNTYSNALIAIGGGNGYTAAFGGRYALNDGSTPKVYGTPAPVGTPFNYYIFERSSTIPASNFGLEVRNANNEITFSTAQRTMRVLTLANGVEGFGGDRVTYGGRQLAFCQAAWAGHRISGDVQTYSGGQPVIIGDPGGPDEPGHGGYQYGWNNDGKIYGGYVTDGGQTVGSAVVSFDDVYIGPQGDPNQPPEYDLPLNLFIVDVTGIPVGTQFY